MERLRFRCTLCAMCCMKSDISLISFEAPILKELARRVGIDAAIEPLNMVYDEKNGVNIAISYVLKLKDGVCPFLDRDTNLCRIHGLYKPLICRSYPYVPSSVRYLYDPITRVVFHTANYAVSAACPVVKEDREKYGFRVMTKPHEYMPEEYRWAIIAENTRATLLQGLTELWRKGMVELKFSVKVTSVPVVNLYRLLKATLPHFAILPKPILGNGGGG